MAESTNRVHVSPGIYMSEAVDMKAAANSLGITKLALVGETLKGPAFQPYWVGSPKEYASVFGGTSTKKFAGSNYPKYELPYIANDYLTKSNQLCVVRTLGFSGYNAGPAWLITGEKSNAGQSEKKYVIAVLRARGSYKYRPEYAKMSDDGCTCQSAYDSLTYDVGEAKTVASCNAPKSYNMDTVRLDEYYSLNSEGTQCTSFNLNGTAAGFSASYGDLGRFTIKCLVEGEDNTTPRPSVASNEDLPKHEVSIPVSLNPSDKDYILKVLGTSNDDGDMPLFVESLYDVAWQDLVATQGYDTISKDLAKFNVGYAADYCGLDAVTGILTKHEGELSKKDFGKRYLYTTDLTDASPKYVKHYLFDYKTNAPIKQETVAKLSVANAKLSEIHLEIGEMFEIADTDDNAKYNGVWVNDFFESASIKELMNAPQVGGTSTRYILRKGTELDTYKSATCENGHIYTVAQITDSNGTRHYVYKAYKTDNLPEMDSDEKIKAEDRLLAFMETNETNRKGSIVYNYEDGLYYKNTGKPMAIWVGEVSNTMFTAAKSGSLSIDGANSSWVLRGGESNPTETIERNANGTWSVEIGKKYQVTPDKEYVEATRFKAYIYEEKNGKTVIKAMIEPVACDLNDYKSAYRYSSTPWVVSNAKGDTNHIELNKLFRFHTISDGSNSVNEVKVSIENIRPDLGQFDVVVRPYNDTDASVSVLERFSKCTMASGKKFIGYMIGTLDGQYESKSKYITVEVADTSAAKNSVPAGFLGYSVPVYNAETIAENDNPNVYMAPIKYNTNYDEDKSKKKQYFGISDITGYDYDYFSFKGNMATIEDPEFTSHGFHLDCRLDKSSYGAGAPKITVDGEEGYVFDTVSVNARTSSQPSTPIIAGENEMYGSIYEDIKLRKFTLVFANGFDGWDIYRDQRTNTDEFAYSSYKGYINKGDGIGYAFDTLNVDGSAYGIEGAAITSDYYSTLAGISMLKNPEEVDINLLATPGIDIINNSKLVGQIFDILEDRADTFYIVTTPDKESGAGDFADDIPEVDETVSDFEDTELHSGYAATYYPWVKIEDNGEYLYIPATRDVVRNIAESDNSNTTMNLAPAGLTRGKVKAIRARKNLKLAECDELYEANINPVRTYAQEGVVIMGQKTLRETDDLLNRIDVRRCVLRMRKLIAIGTLGLIFEPNDTTTVKSFKSIVNGIMDGFVKNRAISNWKMDVDESEEARDRLEIPATIYIKPLRALEYISISFVVTNNGAYFED